MPDDRFVELRGLRFHYRDWGGEGPPLVLMHGLASNAAIWNLTAPLLTERYRVLALNQRGHGLSDKPDDGYDFASICGDLAAFVEALDLERPAVVGHSWGASVALAYAVHHPDSPAALVLVDGGIVELSSFEGMTLERALQVMAPPPLAGMKLDTFLQGARNWPGLAEVWSDDVQEIVLANFRVEDGAIYPHLTRENHLKILHALWDEHPPDIWGDIPCPVLLVPAHQTPKDDRTRIWMEHKRTHVAIAEERGRDVETVWLEDTIHDIPLQRPAELAGAIRRFLERG